MLVLTRKEGEAIVVGDSELVIVVCKVFYSDKYKKNIVKLGFEDNNKNIPVNRHEIFVAKKNSESNLFGGKNEQKWFRTIN